MWKLWIFGSREAQDRGVLLSYWTLTNIHLNWDNMKKSKVTFFFCWVFFWYLRIITCFSLTNQPTILTNYPSQSCWVSTTRWTPSVSHLQATEVFSERPASKWVSAPAALAAARCRSPRRSCRKFFSQPAARGWNLVHWRSVVRCGRGMGVLLMNAAGQELLRFCWFIFYVVELELECCTNCRGPICKPFHMYVELKHFNPWVAIRANKQFLQNMFV